VRGRVANLGEPMDESKNPYLSLSSRPSETSSPESASPPAESEAPGHAPQTSPGALAGSWRPRPGSVAVPEREDQLPAVAVPASATPHLVGVHGGAGETQLSRYFGFTPAGHCWPSVPAGQVQSRAVLVARTHATGLARARAAVRQWLTGEIPGCHLMGLLLVPDAPGRLPKPLRHEVERTAGAVPHIWQVPWVELWRIDQDADLPRAIHHLLDQVRDQIQSVMGDDQCPPS